MSIPYFEGQNSKDCVLHSMNNAFGRKVVDKQEVLNLINMKAAKLAQDMVGKGSTEKEISKAVNKLRNRYSSGSTFFAADIVWETVKNKGLYSKYLPIPGFSSPHIRFSSLTPQILAKPIIILGGDNNGGTHAIAVRGGNIYDSERAKEGPVPLTLAHLKKSLPKVFGAYVFINTPAEASAIKQTSSTWFVEN